VIVEETSDLGRKTFVRGNLSKCWKVDACSFPRTEEMLLRKENKEHLLASHSSPVRFVFYVRIAYVKVGGKLDTWLVVEGGGSSSSIAKMTSSLAG
jgi:hypothetical protein